MKKMKQTKFVTIFIFAVLFLGLAPPTMAKDEHASPEGKAANWIQTAPGRGWFTVLRLYSPLQPWFDKTCRPGEVELVK